MGRKLATAAAALISVIALSGCGVTLTPTSNSIGSSPEATQDVVAATSSIDAKKQLPAGKKVEFTANVPYVLESVSIGGSGREPVHHIVEGAGDHWVSPPLEPSMMTEFVATLHDSVTGHIETVTRSVQTGPAEDTFTASVFPSGGTYGVGILPSVSFSEYVPERDRPAMTERLHVSSTPTAVTGSWHWDDGYSAVFRPDKFWPGDQKVTVSADIRNALIRGDKGEPNIWGKEDTSDSFRTDRGMVIYVDSATDVGVAKIDGKVVRKFGVSTGRPGFTTRSGIKTITDKLYVTRMTNIGVTDDEVYDLQVPFAMRMTDTGEFLHAAPWNGNIGYANTSHGCTNLTYDTAAWIFARVSWGTPVVTKNTGRSMEEWNGPGARWNIPDSEWANA